MLVELGLGAAAVVGGGVAVVKHYGLAAVEAKIASIQAEVSKDYSTASADVKAVVAKIKSLL
jgi:hypothetical protein